MMKQFTNKEIFDDLPIVKLEGVNAPSFSAAQCGTH